MCKPCLHLPQDTSPVSGHFSSCSEGSGRLSPISSCAASCLRSRSEECCGRDPGLWPPRLESFVLRSLYGCVRVNGQLQPVSAPCLGSKWVGIRLRGYITLQHSAFLDTTHPECRSPARHCQGKWHQPRGVTGRFHRLFYCPV